MTDEELISDMLEHDFIVRMPPERRYPAELDVKEDGYASQRQDRPPERGNWAEGR